MLLKQCNLRKFLIDTNKNTIYLTILIYFLILTDVFFSNCYWESSMLFDCFDHGMQAMQDGRQRGKEKMLESAEFEVRKSQWPQNVWRMECQQT